MRTRAWIAMILVVSVVSLGVFAGPFLGRWSNAFTFVDVGSGLTFRDFESIFEFDYVFGDLRGTSFSEFYLPGFLWQGFGLTGSLGAFGVQADLLFCPLIQDFLYAQSIVGLSIGGVDIGWYWAQLSDAVLGGPADGGALRFSGSLVSFDIVSITEFSARIKDEDFDGIQIVHAATGLSKSYATFPISLPQTGSSRNAWTGEKLTISGFQFGCIENISATLYMSCASGFEWVRYEIEGIGSGLSWLDFAVGITFTLQTKSVIANPRLLLGESTCIDAYLDARGYADAPTSVTAITLYGFGLTHSWNGVTVKELTVLDPSRYMITTPEYGSMIASIAEVVYNGYDYYPDYWELFSIEVNQDGCCGGLTSFSANTYFDESANTLFDWAMTHVEGKFAISSKLVLTGLIEVDTMGLDQLGVGFELIW
jgi:hypothetical protein